VAKINLAIGATGVVSGECKMIVGQYGDQIIELLLEEVLYSANSCTSCRTVLHLKIITLMVPACHIEHLFLVSGLNLCTDIFLLHW
jgi:hypothetical protein